MPEPTKKKGMFSKIETREDALKALRDCAGGFFVVAGLQALLGALLAPSLIIDAVVLAVLAFILRQWRSRVAAVLLLILSVMILGVTVGNRLGVVSQGGGNIFLAIIMVLVGIRAAQATFLLGGKLAAAAPSAPLRPPAQTIRR